MRRAAPPPTPTLTAVAPCAEQQIANDKQKRLQTTDDGGGDNNDNNHNDLSSTLPQIAIVADRMPRSFSRHHQRDVGVVVVDVDAIIITALPEAVIVTWRRSKLEKSTGGRRLTPDGEDASTQVFLSTTLEGSAARIRKS